MATTKRFDKSAIARARALTAFVEEMEDTKQMALEALSVYREPVGTIEELRGEVDEELKGFSLSEYIIRERQARL
ncbi:MAG: hypothetical protein HY532_02590 [Chloroflexi bacterium]|nr:hypothetical protein [Chloroflexota bacterium]